ncbi:hypothetical protein RJ639_007212 [Escallonia herrerae]|uniref:Uncharacterized protein n=1 Tax=Escallonia herrerae TaxID=1293975 RepID=A0AA89AW93_9ASTE|nr:hypothetical protein RJ639_007212 [Escallonia herrerae]
MKQKQKWEEDDTYCKGYILGGLSDMLYNVYEIKYASSTAKEIWDDLDSKYKTENIENKKLLISKLFDFCMLRTKNDSKIKSPNSSSPMPSKIMIIRNFEINVVLNYRGVVSEIRSCRQRIEI